MEPESSSDNGDQKFPNEYELIPDRPEQPTHLKRTRDARRAPVYCAATDEMLQNPCDKPMAAYIPT